MRERVIIRASDDADRRRALYHRAQRMITEALARLDETGRDIYIEVGEYRRSRSAEQNARYWAIIGAIADHTGHSKDEIHEYCKQRFLPPRVIEIDGQQVMVPTSTTTLSTAEFAAYMDQVEAWAATELGVVIPVEV